MDEAGARRVAERVLAEPHHVAVEVWERGGKLFTLLRPSAPEAPVGPQGGAPGLEDARWRLEDAEARHAEALARLGSRQNRFPVRIDWVEDRARIAASRRLIAESLSLLREASTGADDRGAAVRPRAPRSSIT
jgi:hypothetical protein